MNWENFLSFIMCRIPQTQLTPEHDFTIIGQHAPLNKGKNIAPGEILPDMLGYDLWFISDVLLSWYQEEKWGFEPLVSKLMWELAFFLPSQVLFILHKARVSMPTPYTLN